MHFRSRYARNIFFQLNQKKKAQELKMCCWGREKRIGLKISRAFTRCLLKESPIWIKCQDYDPFLMLSSPLTAGTCCPRAAHSPLLYTMLSIWSKLFALIQTHQPYTETTVPLNPGNGVWDLGNLNGPHRRWHLSWKMVSDTDLNVCGNHITSVSVAKTPAQNREQRDSETGYQMEAVCLMKQLKRRQTS